MEYNRTQSLWCYSYIQSQIDDAGFQHKVVGNACSYSLSLVVLFYSVNKLSSKRIYRKLVGKGLFVGGEGAEGDRLLHEES